MRKAYLSMPADTPQGIRDRLIRHIINNFDVSSVSYWKKGTHYTEDALLEADLVYSYVPEFAWHEDNDVYVYLGRGQFSEYNKIIDDTKFSVINDEGQLFHPEHGVLNDENDWKRKYGKLWVTPMEEPKTEVVINNKLLLLLTD